MYWRHLRNDLSANKVVTAALIVVVTLSALLMAAGAMVTERLAGSVDRLFADARPPHFLQMHTGDYSTADLERFASEQPGIESWFIEDMIGFDGAAIQWSRPGMGEGGDLSASLIDNLFVTQSPEFDLLLDADGDAPRPTRGEVWVPVAYQTRFGLERGDRLDVVTDTGPVSMTVQGAVRDAQMASSMSSATRFVVSPEDWRALTDGGGGTPEIIVEYRLADEADATAFQSAYEADGSLPTGGQAVTYQLIRLINVISDGLVAAALVGVSLLLIVIALLTLRFVIRGSLESEVRQIGALKAIGLSNRDVSRLYLTRYAAIALVACVLGGLLAIPVADALTASIQVNYAAPVVGPLSVAAPLAALVLVFVVVVAICRSILRRIRHIQVVTALVHGSTLDEKRAAAVARRNARLARSGGIARGAGPLNLRLALRGLRADAGQWALVPAVLGLVTVAVALPVALLGTFESPRFMSYFGAPDADLRADIQGASGVDAVHDRLLALLETDPRVTEVRSQASIVLTAVGGAEPLSVRVEAGEHAADGIEFVEGVAPGAGQIALSTLNAERLGVAVGQPLLVLRGGQEVPLTVSGTYQDVTSGGFTARATDDLGAPRLGWVVYADTAEGVDVASLARELDGAVEGASVVPMRDFVAQTLGYVTDALRGAAVVSTAMGLGVALLITALFLELWLNREKGQLGAMYALGFSSRELRTQLLVRVLLTAGLGVALGTVFVATLGEPLVGGLLSAAGLGLSRLSFLADPLLLYVAIPAGLLAVALGCALVLGVRMARADKSVWLRQA